MVFHGSSEFVQASSNVLLWNVPFISYLSVHMQLLPGQCSKFGVFGHLCSDSQLVDQPIQHEKVAAEVARIFFL